jgi:hypothetical protein
MTADSEVAPAQSGFDPATVSELLARSLEACTAWKRTDLTAKLRLAQVRLSRPSTLVCVIGEYKQGKSLLVDALVGSPVCPVDDDLATTAITALYGAEIPTARVRRVVDGERQHEEVSVEQLARYVTEESDPSERAGIELVEVGVPSPGLEGGLTLVDMPGVGGMLHQHAASTLRFLGLADAVIFVTGASQELTATEVAFLEQARQVCPTALVVVTKVDLYPEWQRIVDLNRQHLVGRADDVEVLPVSSSLRMEALARDDSDLEQESAIPQLLETIRERVVNEARRKNAERAVGEMKWALGRLLQPVETELEILADPEKAKKGMEHLRATQHRLKELQEAGAHWSTLLNDGFTDLRTDVDYQLRTAVRNVLTNIDVQLEELDPASDWESFTREIQETLSLAATEVLATIDTGAESIRDAITALLSDDEEVVPDLRVTEEPDVMAMWSDSDRELKTVSSKGFGSALSSGLTALRGASSGMILLGVVGNVAGFALAAPISLGAAALFGTKQVLDTRKTALKQRRQEARTVVRQHIDEVNLELTNRTRQLVQDSHRTLRDHYSARLQELLRSTVSALQTTQEGLAKDQAERQKRVELLGQWAAQLHGQLDELSTTTGEGST